jgi:S1-C subfamily serine protease
MVDMNGTRVAVLAGVLLAAGLLVSGIALFVTPSRTKPHPPPVRAPASAPVAVKAVAPVTVPAQAPRPPRDSALEAPILESVRAAAVFLQVKHVSYLDGKIEKESSGSGFFISNDGRIATCWHVVSAKQEAPELIIPLKLHKLEAVIGSGTRRQSLFPARILAADPKNDLAILKVDYQPKAWLELGDSDRLVRTTPVWVLGYPLGKVFSVLQRGPEYSINRGHVSSLRHDDLERLDRIQFDAAVTPGNSGGPVFGNDGKVLGVANIAFGTSRVNFAIPAAKVARMLEDCPLERGVGETCAVSITSVPAGARVFLDGQARGVTPLTLKLPASYGFLQLAAAKRRSWGKWVTLYDGLKVHAELKPLDRKTLKTSPNAGAPAGGVKPLPHGDVLLAQDFADLHAADDWRQDTGGSGSRTWYVDGGTLHQWSGDALLHAIFTGDETWTDYALTARVRIAQNKKDGRAGLIFRANSDGFALFRLHRGRGVVQLAYHASDPFGWQVLAERRLPLRVQGGRWYRMEVQAVGKRVRCFIDGRPVLEAVLDLARQGGIGFYSVDSQASFDDLRVLKLQADAKEQPAEATMNSYWFNESFERASSHWGAFLGQAPAPPWPTVTGACMQLDRDKRHARNMLRRYNVCDSQVAVKASCAEGTLGMVLRDDGRRRYVCGVDCNSGRVFVRLDDGEQRKILAEKTELRIRDAVHITPGTPIPLIYLVTQQQGSEVRFRVVLIGTPDLRTLLAEDDQKPDPKAQLRFGVLAQVEVLADDATLKSGRLGFYADRARVLFHSLQVSDGGRE